jgi:phosphatidylglycerol:prolipoprotein diacylglycerol transferase
VFPVLLRLGPYSLFGWSLGPFSLHTYGLLVAVGFLVALGVVLRGAKREGLPAEAVMDLAFMTVVAAIAGSRLLYVVFNYREYLAAPLRVFMIWEGGLIFHGGLLLAIPVCWAVMRRTGLPLWPTADLIAPAIAIGQGIGRLGCFAAGCCYGCPTDSPLGVVFTHPEALAPLNVPLLPVQLFSALSGLVIFGLLTLYRRFRRAPGQVFWLYLVLASAARMVEDLFRSRSATSSFLPGLTATQALGIALGIVGIACFVRFGRAGRRA